MSVRQRPKPKTLGELRDLRELEAKVELETEKAIQLEADNLLQQAKVIEDPVLFSELAPELQAELSSIEIQHDGSLTLSDVGSAGIVSPLGGMFILVMLGFIFLARRL